MIAFVGPSSLTVSGTDTVHISQMGSILGIELGIKLGTELESKLGSRVGTELGGGFPWTEAVLGSKLGTGLDIKLDFNLETVLDRRRRTVVVLNIKVGSRLGNGLGLELGTAKSKSNISVPTGNQRLWQEEDMIAFVGPSSSTVSAADMVDDREPRTVLDIKLDFKLGTVLDREPSTVVVHDIKLDFKLGTVLDTRRRTVLDIKLGSKIGTVLDRKLL
jgi:hypothetical protein